VCFRFSGDDFLERKRALSFFQSKRAQVNAHEECCVEACTTYEIISYGCWSWWKVYLL